MTRIIEVDGLFFEVTTDESALQKLKLPNADPPPEPGQRKLRTPTDKGALENKLTNAAEAIDSTIAAVCGKVAGAFAAANRPDELTVKFGIKLAGKVGIPYITEGSSEAALNIEATWKNPPLAPPTAPTKPSESELER